MRIEVFYVPDCPNYKPAVEAVTNVLASEALQAEICEVPVRNEGEAHELGFPGSPTVRVNGSDVEPESASIFGFACRLYLNGMGVPSEAAIRNAVSAALQKE